MFCPVFFNYPFWWIFPLIMIALCFSMCFFVMRGRMGPMMWCLGRSSEDIPRTNAADAASDILDKRYALGEINKEEYEEKKEALNKVK